MAANPSLLILHPSRFSIFLKPSLLVRPLSLRPRYFFLSPRSHSSSSSSAAASAAATPQSLNFDTNETGRSDSRTSPPIFETLQKIDVNPPKGTRDFPPDEMRLRSWLFHNFREVSRLYGFEEVDFPVLESEALYIRKAGEEIRDQLYCFEDRGNRRVALRPELTPSLARLVIQKGKSLSLPIKWFAVGQCWRYERMTRGRRREHYQWNMDIIGVADIIAEAELLSSIVTFFKRIGITASDVGFKISSRKVLQEVLSCYSIPEALFGKVCIIIDKKGKIPIDEIKKELEHAQLSDVAIEELLQVLSLKCLSKLEEKLGPEAVSDLKRLFSLADKFGFSEWIQFDASVVRGLAYYTGIVFEGFDREGKLRAICGGGRYDHLLSTFGGDDIPACGFGFGDAVIVELLKEKGLLPELTPHVENIVCSLDYDLQGAAAAIAAKLRGKGQSVDLVLECKSLKWVFKRAARINAERLILVGSSEWQKVEMVTGRSHQEDREKNPSATTRGATRSWGTTVSGQSVSTSGSVGSPSSRSEAAMATPVSESTFLRLNHLDIHRDDAGSPVGNKKKKRGQRAVGGDKNGRGLRQFSMKVCEKVESKGRTTYNEVADELVAEFADPSNSISSPDQQQYDEKNIRRRVYDALNVLMAMDIISKDKKEIQWKGLPRTTLNDIEELKSERLGLRSRIEKKATYLQELEEQYVGLQNLIQRNEQLYSSGDAPSGGVALPFILVQTRPHATVEVEISEDMQLVHFDFNSTPFELHDDNYVLKAMKFCERPQQGDDTAHNIPADGGESSSMPSMFQPQIAHPSRLRLPPGRPSTSPPLPGILKARVKHEH